MDLVSSPSRSQSSQFSNSMRSPTTDVASAQSSQLAHPSYFSNPALMDDSNLPSLHVDTNSLPTPTRGRRRRREPSPSPPLSPASSTPHQRPRTHTYASHFLSTLTIAPSPWPALLLCNNEFSINQKFEASKWDKIDILKNEYQMLCWLCDNLYVNSLPTSYPSHLLWRSTVHLIYIESYMTVLMILDLMDLSQLDLASTTPSLCQCTLHTIF